MTYYSGLSRRDFMKRSAAASAVLAGGSLGTLVAAPRRTLEIPKGRAVCCHDSAMDGNSSRYADNMDEMARRLTGESTALAAWNAIFSPVDSDKKIGIVINQNLGRPDPIIEKLVAELTRKGAQLGNIMVYCGGTKFGKGGTSGNFSRTEADLYISLGFNRGHPGDHGFAFGKYTMSAKCHYGTWSPGGWDQLQNVNVNWMGDKQMLAMIDSVYADSHMGSGSQRLDLIAMGIMAGALDHQFAVNERVPLGWQHDDSTSQQIAGMGNPGTLEWIKFEGGDTASYPREAARSGNGEALMFRTGEGHYIVRVDIPLDVQGRLPVSIDSYGLDGKRQAALYKGYLGAGSHSVGIGRAYGRPFAASARLMRVTIDTKVHSLNLPLVK
jgi:hypothetical protein